jgi:hypothetical protein
VESAQYCDISGLDDLFTEQPRVVQGMIDIYDDWIGRFDLAGMRLDAFKHVNPEFWQAFLPAVQSAAEARGRPDFLIFGEVYDYDPAVVSEIALETALPAVLVAAGVRFRLCLCLFKLCYRSAIGIKSGRVFRSR